MKKEDFINRVKSSLGRREAVMAKPPSLLEPIQNYESKELIERFRQEYESVDGIFHLVSSKAAALKKLNELIEELEVKTYIKTNHKYLKTIVDKLEIEQATNPEDADLGISSAHCLIANTGTIVLDSSTGRKASLLPMKHIAIVKADQLVPSVAEALQDYMKEPPSSWVQATGPSRTADIELTLTIGVHAPGIVHVIMVK